MKKFNKLLSALLAFTLIVSMVPKATMKSQVDEAVVYVSASGNNHNTGAAGAPVADINKAITLLNGMSGTDKVIYIDGTVNFDAPMKADSLAPWHRFEENTTPITIRGINSGKIIFPSRPVVFSGDVTFQDITLRTTGNTTLCAAGHNVVMGDNVTHEGNFRLVSATSYDVEAPTDGVFTNPNEITISSGYVSEVFLGTAHTFRTIKIPGATFTLNGGEVDRIRISKRGEESGKVQFTGNANIVINGGKVNHSIGLMSDVTFTDGAAVQLIYNNDSFDQVSISDGMKPELINLPNVTNAGGELYVLICESGGMLTPTETAGIYTVESGDRTAVVYGDSDQIVAESCEGTLTIPSPGTYTVKWSDTVNCYVKASGGNDDNDGRTPATAVASIYRGLEVLASKPAANKNLFIDGTFDFEEPNPYESDNGDGTTTKWHFFSKDTTPIIIKGLNDGADIICFPDSGPVVFGGPLVFENLTLRYSGEFTSAAGHEMVFGNNLTMEVVNPEENEIWYSTAANHGVGAPEAVAVDGKLHTVYTERQKLTMNSGAIKQIVLGMDFTYRDAIIPGVSFTLNGGTATAIRISRGPDTATNTGTLKFTDDVNIVINGGVIEDSIGIRTGVSFEDGAALQLIYNNGRKAPTAKPDGMEALEITPANVAAHGGELYELHCAAGGGSLEPTETAGKYKVNGDYTAIATDTTDSTVQFHSTGEYLTLDPGVYQVTWEESAVCYVSANGNDGNSGSQASPFRTINKAVAFVADRSASDKIIYIMGAFSFAEKDNTNKYLLGEHTERITIKGDSTTQSPTITLPAKESVYLNGPICFEDITLDLNSATLFARGNELIFGSNTEFTNITSSLLFTGTSWNIGLPQDTYSYQAAHNMEINSDTTFPAAQLGVDSATVHTKIPGGTVTLNNGKLQFFRFRCGSGGANGKLTFTDDVNFVMNGGSIEQTVGIQGDISFSDDAALQMIYNNGLYKDAYYSISDNFKVNKENIESRGGTFYELRCAVGGGILEPTETAGKYKVKGGYTAVATDTTNSALQFHSTGEYLTVDPGTYDVTWTTEGTMLKYEVEPCVFVCDGSSQHYNGIKITSSATTNPVIQYSTDRVTWDYFTSRTNVGKNDFWYKITDGSVVKYGKSTIEVVKGTNAFTTPLTCSSLYEGATPSPYAESKWGNANITYTYYSVGDSNNMTKLGAAPTKAGFYAVEANVPASGNYEALTSKRVYFTIYETDITTDSGGNYDDVKGKDSLKVSVDRNNEFMVAYSYYYTPSDERITLKFEPALPNNTTLAVISYNGNELCPYYYKTSAASTDGDGNTVITSDQFHCMGASATSSFEPTQRIQVSQAIKIVAKLPDNTATDYTTTISLTQGDVDLTSAQDVIASARSFNKGTLVLGSNPMIFSNVVNCKIDNLTLSTDEGVDSIVCVKLKPYGEDATLFTELPTGTVITMENAEPLGSRGNAFFFRVTQSGKYHFWIYLKNYSAKDIRDYELQVEVSLCESPKDALYPLLDEVYSQASVTRNITLPEHSTVDAATLNSRYIHSVNGGSLTFTTEADILNILKKDDSGNYIDADLAQANLFVSDSINVWHDGTATNAGSASANVTTENGVTTWTSSDAYILKMMDHNTYLFGTYGTDKKMFNWFSKGGYPVLGQNIQLENGKEYVVSFQMLNENNGVQFVVRNKNVAYVESLSGGSYVGAFLDDKTKFTYDPDKKLYTYKFVWNQPDGTYGVGFVTDASGLDATQDLFFTNMKLCEGDENITVSGKTVTFKAGTPAGDYRIVFKKGNAAYNYNVLVY